MVWELVTAMPTAAVAWFHLEGQVAVGVQFLPVAGSAAIDPDRSKTRSRSGGRREVGLRLEPQFASAVGVGAALSTVTPVPPTPGIFLPPTPSLFPVLPPPAISTRLKFGGGDQVQPPINAMLPRLTMVARLAWSAFMRCMQVSLSSLRE